MLLFDLNHILKLKTASEKLSEKLGEASLLGAFAWDDTLTLKVRVPRALYAAEVSLSLYRDSDMSTRRISAELSEFGNSSDVYSLTLKLSELCGEREGGLFYYNFCIATPLGEVYTERDGSLKTNEDSVSRTQLTVYTPSMHVPEKFRNGMMYQIFVDRFFDGGRPILPDSGKIHNPDWETGTPMYAEKPGDALANNEFFGGNLWGVADKLDHIASLGVDTLYLCPIFESASNHKYDTGDYTKIDRMFGGEEALAHLISECKARGMHIILDGVFNHTGADSRYFNKFGNYDTVGAYNSADSEYYKWYSFYEYPDRYNCWWGVKILPAVKSEEPTYREFICGEDGVIRRWLKFGIDGWRLDVVDELSDVFLDKLKSAARAENPDAFVIGEVWEDASNKIAYDKRRRYFSSGQLDSVMNYPLKEAVVEYILSGNCRRLSVTASELYAHYPTEVSHSLMNFLGTHDTERILTVLADVGTKDMTNRELAGFRLDEKQRRLARKRLKLAWMLLCAFPGIPCIYYGDEAGMEGGHDPFNRMPYAWGREDKELLGFYRKIGALRKGEKLFSEGDLRIIDTGDAGQFMLCRSFGGRTLAACVNMSDRDWNIEFDKAPIRLLGRGRCDSVVTLPSESGEYFVLQ